MKNDNSESLVKKERIKTMLHPLLEQNRSALELLCASHHIKRLYAFGSVCREDFTPESDVDLLFTFDYDTLPVIDAADVYFDFIDKAEALLQRSVDLVSEKAIENPYLKASIDEDKVLLYETYPEDVFA
jgi:uncharacterized protein